MRECVGFFLEHLECSHQPHIQGQGAQNRASFSLLRPPPALLGCCVDIWRRQHHTRSAWPASSRLPPPPPPSACLARLAPLAQRCRRPRAPSPLEECQSPRSPQSICSPAAPASARAVRRYRSTGRRSSTPSRAPPLSACARAGSRASPSSTSSAIGTSWTSRSRCGRRCSSRGRRRRGW